MVVPMVVDLHVNKRGGGSRRAVVLVHHWTEAANGRNVEQPAITATLSAGSYPDITSMDSTCAVAAAVCVSSPWLSLSQLGVESDKDIEIDSSSRRNVGSISRNASRSSSRRALNEAGRDLRVDRVRTRTRLEASADAVHSAARAAETVEVFMVGSI